MTSPDLTPADAAPGDLTLIETVPARRGSRLRRTSRWLAPVAAVALVAGLATVPHMVSSANASPPDLPTLTPAELLAKARTAQVSNLSGTLKLTANLGLPSLGSLASLGGGGASTSIASLISGEHTAKVWYDGPEHLRMATIAPLAETNWIRNGNDLWSYDSTTLTTTHATIPAKSASTGTKDSGTDAVDAKDTSGSTTGSSVLDPVHDTPIQFAQALLDQVTPSTTVAVDTATRIAGRPVYQLVLTPNDVHSTVGEVTLAIDAATGLPLDAKVTARSSGSTALEFGFTDVSFDKLAASTFQFTPPPGSTVVEAKDPAALLAAGGDTHDGQRRHRDDASTSDGTSTNDGSGGGYGSGPAGLGDSKVLGKDWTSVVVLSSSPLNGQFGSLLASAPDVTVGSTHGRLISTTLFNVLVLDDGRVAIGAVDAETLQALVAAG